MNILLLTLTDDPFDPSGHGRFGGSHAFFFDLARQLVRMGHDITIVTRLNSSKKQENQELGINCRIFRLPVGPAAEIDHHSFSSLVHAILVVMKEVLRDHTFDIVQTSNWLSGSLAAGGVGDGIGENVLTNVSGIGLVRE